MKRLIQIYGILFILMLASGFSQSAMDQKSPAQIVLR